MPPPDDEESLRIFRAHQSEALGEADRAESALEPLFKETSEEIRSGLANADNMNGVQIRKTIDDGFQKTVFRRRKAIATAIEESAKKGPKAVRKTMRAKFGDDTTRAQVRSSKAALEEGAERIAGRVTVDNVSLSKRIRRWDKELGGEMAAEVERGIKAKKGILQIAKKIEQLDTVTEGLPKYLQQVESLARAGSPELKAVAKGYLKRAQKELGQVVDGSRKATPYSLRSPTQRFLRDIQKAGAEGVDAVVKKYVEEKAAWRAKVIARGESVQAMKQAYIENAKRKPGVYAFQWTLSSSHPKPDECSVFANQNVCGLGPGVYTADRLPKTPHPFCLCSTHAVMDSKHFDRSEGDPGPREEFADRKSPDAAGWLKQNDQAAAAILGPTRHEMFKRGANVLDPTGKPLPVGELLTRHAHAAE